MGAARRRTRIVGIVAICVAAGVAFSAAVGGSILAAQAFSASLRDVRIDTAPTLGYGPEQLANACTIIVTGRDLGFGPRDQTIAVMTAMGESSLRNLAYGDAETSGVTNPDGSRTTSLGLFQQQDNWGTRAERMDPSTAATLFYRALAAHVPDRDTIEPTLVAHRVQINADPQHYAGYWTSAARVVDALTGAPDAAPLPAGVATCAEPSGALG